MINYLFIALLFLVLSGCTNSDDDKENNEPSIMVPNYLVINAPSKSPDMPWHVSDFFKKAEQWELETGLPLERWTLSKLRMRLVQMPLG